MTSRSTRWPSHVPIMTYMSNAAQSVRWALIMAWSSNTSRCGCCPCAFASFDRSQSSGQPEVLSGSTESSADQHKPLWLLPVRLCRFCPCITGFSRTLPGFHSSVFCLLTWQFSCRTHLTSFFRSSVRVARHPTTHLIRTCRPCICVLFSFATAYMRSSMIRSLKLARGWLP